MVIVTDIIKSNMKDVTFQLDQNAGAKILQNMAMPTVQKSAAAIAARANSMAASVTSEPPDFTVSSQVGTIRRGRRAIATVRASTQDAHQGYIANMTLAKAKDAGRVN